MHRGSLVPGDVVLLESGDRIPADLRLVDVKNLRTEEAALTGESVPIDKTTAAVTACAARMRSKTLLVMLSGKPSCFTPSIVTRMP